MLTTKGGLALEIAQATVAMARHEGFRMPMRYRDPRCRPNHRPQPRWDHVPDSAVESLVLFASHRRPAVTPAAMPVQLPGRQPHPELLVNVKAWQMLSAPDDRALTALQVGQALQLASPSLRQRGLVVQTVGELARVFADPPLWLLDFHYRLAKQRSKNHARQTRSASGPSVGGADAGLEAKGDALFAPTDLNAAAVVRAEPVRPHPELLVSVKATSMLALPPAQRLTEIEVGRALQLAWPTLRRHGLVIRNVGQLAAVFADPPQWLIDAHAELAANPCPPKAAASVPAVAGAPHPEILISGRLQRMLERPAGTRLCVTQVAKALQYPQVPEQVESKLAAIKAVSALAVLLHDPPRWLLTWHRTITSRRATTCPK
ncbi:hypothetical protein ABZ729_37080 [Streptomyces sp. NPDC006678]|uniref:hypothetical protein n=1 Tax=Streptomyces sp. NPDC006678 TaxID=3157185 RepID=UPI003406584F